MTVSVVPPTGSDRAWMDPPHPSINRRLTAIYYLNPGWQPARGGELALYTPAGTRIVAPVLDRLVVFIADEVEHEVMPSLHERWAITAWYYAAG